MSSIICNQGSIVVGQDLFAIGTELSATIQLLEGSRLFDASISYIWNLSFEDRDLTHHGIDCYCVCSFGTSWFGTLNWDASNLLGQIIN